jgi:hypothetical protein
MDTGLRFGVRKAVTGFWIKFEGVLAGIPFLMFRYSATGETVPWMVLLWKARE